MTEQITAPNLIRWQTGTSPPEKIGLMLHADNGATFSVAISRSQLSPLITELAGRAASLPTMTGSTPAFETLPMKSIGADAVAGPDGQIGISIRLEGGLRLTLGSRLIKSTIR